MGVKVAALAFSPFVWPLVSVSMAMGAILVIFVLLLLQGAQVEYLSRVAWECVSFVYTTVSLNKSEK